VCASRRLKYIIRLQAPLAEGELVQSIQLTAAFSNDTGSRPIIAYLFGPDANQARMHVAPGSLP
jgi:hypothetical protein